MNPIESADIRTAPVFRFAEIGSTNEEGLGRARRGDVGPTWFRADIQTQGRGRQHRPWASPKGNLYTSLVVPVVAEPACIPQIAHVAAVALVDAIRAMIAESPTLHIKWPNDLLIGGAKVAGILVEATTGLQGRRACVIGWGVNCAFHPEGLPYPATDLSAAAGRAIGPDALFPALVDAMADAIALWDQGRGFAEIRSRWLANALPLDTPLTVQLGQAQVTGRFQGIDKSGRLLLLGSAGPITLEAGDVFLSDRSAAANG